MTTRTDSPLLAGAAKADITPELGMQIAGDIGRHRPVTAIREPLFARALALEKDGVSYAILSLDVLAIDNPWADEIRLRARKRFGIAPDNLIIHITQNHGAPSIGNHFCKDESPLIPDAWPWLRGGDSRYNEPALAGTLTALEHALAARQPVTSAFGRAVDGRLAFNRRFIMRDGTARCHPRNGDPDILCNEGPTDPEVGVLTLTNKAGGIVSALLHHTCHPCCGYGGTEIMADWPGAWCREFEAEFSGSTPLVINGFCGNIHQHNHLDPDSKNDHALMGRRLMASTGKALSRVTPLDVARWNWKRTLLPVPRRPVPPDVLADARKMLQDFPEPKWIGEDRSRVEWDWVYAVGIRDIADDLEKSPCYPYEIQALRLGDFALLAAMGEPFVEAQLRIKRESPFRFTMTAHMCNGYLGYVPTRKAFEGGGYETRIGRGSRLVPEALELVEAESLRLLRQL